MQRVKLAGFGRNGAVYDVAPYDAPPEAFNEVRNVRFNSIGAVAFSGHRSVLAPAPINPLWLRVFPPVDLPRWVYADQQSVYVFDDGHIDISRPGGYNGVLNERWQGEVFSGVGIFNNTVDVPQMWPQFNSATALQDLSNWPSTLRCKFLRPFKYYLIAGFLTDNDNDHPFRVRWSHPADPGTVPASWAVDDPAYDSGEFELSETDDYIVDGRTLGEMFMVYKQKTAHAMYLTGNQRIFGQRTVVSGRGALTRDCVQDIPGGHFVAGIDDIYVHTGQKGSEQSLVEAKTRSWIFNQIDASNFFNCYTVDYRATNEIWFCFPEAGETYPTIAMVWNKITGGIGFRDLQASPFIWAGPVDERTTDGDTWGGDEEEEETITAEFTYEGISFTEHETHVTASVWFDPGHVSELTQLHLHTGIHGAGFSEEYENIFFDDDLVDVDGEGGVRQLTVWNAVPLGVDADDISLYEVRSTLTSGDALATVYPAHGVWTNLSDLTAETVVMEFTYLPEDPGDCVVTLEIRLAGDDVSPRIAIITLNIALTEEP